MATADRMWPRRENSTQATCRSCWAMAREILRAATNFGAGNGPDSVAVGDFNGDGKQDLAVSNQNSNDVSILVRNCPPPNECMVCHKHNTLIVPCSSLEYRRHLDHGDPVGACPNN